jgi:16S rRNA (cytidine1402-2'-O)-methyltransferase
MKLYVVATPLGNLQDLSPRALAVFQKVNFLLCEDTRKTRKLFSAYNLASPRLISYHQHSNSRKIKEILELLKRGEDLALVSDAGTPGISDPGNKLISLALKEIINLEVIPIPGPCALIAALSVAGFPADQFIFYGFLPRKKGRAKILQKIKESSWTVVFYESGHRINKTLEELRVREMKRNIVVARELTKKFESIYRGSIEEVQPLLKGKNLKGEFTVVINNK